MLWRANRILDFCPRKLPLGILFAGVTAIVALAPRHAVTLPLYARQTGQICATCHTAFLELTPFGRRFKLGGYTLGGGDWKGPPFAVMLQPTFTNTQAAQRPGLASTTILSCSRRASLPAARSPTISAPSFRERGTASATALPGTIRTYASQSRSTSTAIRSSGGEPSTTTRRFRMSGTRFPPGAFPT